MQQHHGTGVDTGNQLFESLLLCRLIVDVPVDIGKAPENRLVSELFGVFEVGLAEFALWGPVVFWQLRTGGG